MDWYKFITLIVNSLYTLVTAGILFVAIRQLLLLYDEKFSAIIGFSPRFKPVDTKKWPSEAQLADFILENKGIGIYNVKIVSEPDYLGWGTVKNEVMKNSPKTSDYFNIFSVINKNEVIPIFWCDLEANEEIVKKPFKVIIYYSKKPNKPANKFVEFNFNFSNYKFIWGVNNQYNIHNVAEELSRIRKILEKKSGGKR